VLIGLTLALFCMRKQLDETGPAWLKLLALGVALFLLAMAPYVAFADRLFLRYGYFGHIGLAVGVAALLQGVAESRMGSWLGRQSELSANRLRLAADRRLSVVRNLFGRRKTA
jgi:hypothetical protein